MKFAAIATATAGLTSTAAADPLPCDLGNGDDYRMCYDEGFVDSITPNQQNEHPRVNALLDTAFYCMTDASCVPTASQCEFF